jgi:hypothetical protein
VDATKKEAAAGVQYGPGLKQPSALAGEAGLRTAEATVDATKKEAAEGVQDGPGRKKTSASASKAGGAAAAVGATHIKKLRLIGGEGEYFNTNT